MYLGLFISIISIIITFYFFYLAWNAKITITGWSSLIISIWFFGGVLLSSIGVTGIYIGKTFDQTKKRPTYIIAKKNKYN